MDISGFYKGQLFTAMPISAKVHGFSKQSAGNNTLRRCFGRVGVF
jgi:hypothetical protein